MQFKNKKPPIKIKTSHIKGTIQEDFFLLKQPNQICKILFKPCTYVWCDQNIYDQENKQYLELFANIKIYPILCRSIPEVKTVINNQGEDKIFRIISSAKMGDSVCQEFQYNQDVVHIYIFCGYQAAGQALKNKWNKIKFYSTDISEFLIKIQEQSMIDNVYLLKSINLEITNKQNNVDYSLLNKSRFNLHSLMLFKNTSQAKKDFINLSKSLFSGTKFQEQIQMFQAEYPEKFDITKVLTWFTKQTFFYSLMNNFLKASINPFQTAYIRLPFSYTFRAINQLYRKGDQLKSFKAYRSGTIHRKILYHLEKNIGQYIQMNGFLSTTLDYSIAKMFKGNSIITIIVQNQQRQAQIDYGYAQISKFGNYPEEQQILFNSMNTYKIISFCKQDDVYKITLKYGELARIVKQDSNKVGQKQKNMIINYNYTKDVLNKLKSQGDAFKYSQMFNQQLTYRLTEFKQKYQGKQNIEAADRMFQIGEVYYIHGQQKKSLQNYEKALKIYIKQVGENHIKTADTFYNMGQVYKNINLDKFQEYHEKALGIRKNVLEQNNINLASRMNSLGQLHSIKKEYTKALQYFSNALSIRAVNLGQNHYDMMQILNNIGTVYKNKNEYNKAIDYYEKALRICLINFGTNHINTIMVMNNIAGIIYDKKELNKAQEYYQKIIKIVINIFGQNHLNGAMSIDKIGMIYFNKGEYKKALQKFQSAYEIYGKHLESTHIYVIQALSHIEMCKVSMKL